MAGDTAIGGGHLGRGWRLAIWGGAAALLMVPALAKLFTSEMRWDAADFILMGVMLSALCGAFELAAWLSPNPWYRAALGASAVGAFLLVWVNLAVGMIGSEGNTYNLMFAGVLGIGLLGAILARLRSQGMVFALFAMAVAQAAIGAFALFSGVDPRGSIFSMLFAGFWLLSAAMFWQAGRDRA